MKRLGWTVVALGVTAAAGAGAALFLYKSHHRFAAIVPNVSELLQTPRSPGPLSVADVIYRGKLGEGWADWGWGVHHIGSGPARVTFGSFGGILLHHAELPSRYGGVAFRYRAPEVWGEFLSVWLQGTQSAASFPEVTLAPRHVAKLDDGWREALVEWSELNPSGLPFDRVLIGARREVPSDWVELDEIVLTKPGPQAAPSERKQRLQVQCSRPAHPIDPLIYGAASDEWTSGHSAQRLGGNPLSRFNWELSVWNAGNDWFFENMKQEHTLFEMVDARAKANHPLALVVPMLGWVSKDDKSFGFPRSQFSEQRKYDEHKPEAGDGYSPDGKPLTPGSPEQTSVAAPPELIKRWVTRLVDESKQRGSRGVQIYILDNEPTLWNTTHRDVHPSALSYDELLERSTQYGRAIREADPDALIAGPAEWGWLGYNYSAVDAKIGYQLAPDRRVHGNVPLVPWYLKQIAEYEKRESVRLLDMLDLHFYPAAAHVFGGDAAVDPSTAELRIRSTRALWDPKYRDESWINEPIGLIPRMKEWVRANHPGLKLSIGEWNFGAEEHISGGIATAEALGRFGQQGLDAAFFWGGLKPGTPAFWAFRAFRNFDEHGGRFQDFSVPTVEGEGVSLFASRDESGGHLVLVLINKAPTTRTTSEISLDGCKPVSSTRVFGYAGEKLSEGKAQTEANMVSVVLEPYSIAVVDLKLGEPAPP